MDSASSAFASSSPGATTAEERKYVTVDELREHNRAGDLWISIQGKVYDVSEWVKIHPGGDAVIKSLAGQDVTDAFIAYHPATAWSRLDGLFTGLYLRDFQISDMSRDYRRLASELTKLGLFEEKGHAVMILNICVTLLMAICVSGVVCTKSVLAHMASAALLGLLWIQTAYLGHDAGHYQIMSNRRCNRVMQIIAGNCVTGISIAWWKWTHNAHHIACNSLDYDPDLQHIPVFAVSSRFFSSMRSIFYGREMSFDPVARFLVSRQHWTYYPVMCVARVNLFVQTFLLLFSNRPVPDRALNILGMSVFWTWFPLLVSFLPTWAERAAFVLVAFSVCSVQHIQFTLNHFSADVYEGPPAGNDWFENQTHGTIDITCSPWMDWFFGGLQFQLEHHLFPRLPRCHLRRVSPVVQELCKKHRLPYRSLSFWGANVSTIKTLRTAALQARDLASPVPKNLVWEALNTHG